MSGYEPTISVVLPTRNSMANLPRHVAAMKDWLAFVSEVVVVDSFSEDGTPEFLKEHIDHPNLRVITHPPGLYASWNHGIQNVSGDFVYISTAGDTITADGLRRLREAAVALECDVVVSKPAFYDVAGRRLPNVFWPVDGAVDLMAIQQPRRLRAAEALLLIAAYPQAAFTGSCASCLFRTEVLKRGPFRTEVGVGADGVWCLEHALDVVWGIVPGEFTGFLIHATHAQRSEMVNPPVEWRADRVLAKAARAWSSQSASNRQQQDAVEVDRVIEALGCYLEMKERFDVLRSGRVPWVFSPLAWKTRMRRQNAQGTLRRLVKRGLDRSAHGW